MVDKSCVAEVAPTTTGSQFGWSLVYAQLMTPLSLPAVTAGEPPPGPPAQEPLLDELVHAASRAAANMMAIGTTARRARRRRPNSFTGESPRDRLARTWVHFGTGGRHLPPPYPQPADSDARDHHRSSGPAIRLPSHRVGCPTPICYDQ